MNRTTTAILAAAFTCLWISGIAIGQQSPRGLPGRPGVAAEPAGPMITLDFPGGTLEEYVAMLRAQATRELPVNITIPPEAQEVRIPRVQLSGVTVGTALLMIQEMLPHDQVALNVRDLSSNVSAYSVAIERRLRSLSGNQQLKVYSVRELVAGDDEHAQGRVKPDTLLTAVQVALEQLKSEEAPAEVKFHAESGLLIVRGNSAALDAISQVVKELGDSVRDGMEAGRREAMRKIEIDRSTVRLNLAKRIAETAFMKTERVQKQFASGTISQGELEEVQRERARADADLSLAELEKQAAEKGGFSGASGSSDLVKRMTALEDAVARIQSTLAAMQGGAKGSPAKSER